MNTYTRRDDRILVREGRRHHRRTYSWTEFRLGLLVLGGVGAVLAWVGWRGAHPDPTLFDAGVDRLATGPTAPADRGPLPLEIALPGWSEASLSSFGEDTLYEKINGREGYYKSFGFQRLWFASLTKSDDPAIAIDVEVYDLGEAANALGAYAGERSPGARTEVGGEGMAHFDRNAFYLARGRYYVRAIGSAETPAVRAQLERLRRALEAGLPGEKLPFAYGLLTGQLGFAPARISYFKENAFSFGFARDVYVVRLEDDETELFVARAASEPAAGELRDRFTEGFLGYGEAAESVDGVTWVKDRWLGSFAGVTAWQGWVLGVRAAPDAGSARAALRRLRGAVATSTGTDD